MRVAYFACKMYLYINEAYDSEFYCNKNMFLSL